MVRIASSVSRIVEILVTEHNPSKRSLLYFKIIGQICNLLAYRGAAGFSVDPDGSQFACLVACSSLDIQHHLTFERVKITIIHGES